MGKGREAVPICCLFRWARYALPILQNGYSFSVIGVIPRLILLLSLASSALFAEPELVQAEVSLLPQRDYGLVLGETLGSEIRIAVEPGFQLQTADLPKPGSAINETLEVRGMNWRVEETRAGRVYRIWPEYQVFKGIRQPETLEVPPLNLRFSKGGKTKDTTVSAWQFTLHPLIPANLADDAVPIQADLPLPELAQFSASKLWLALLLAWCGLGIYAAWGLGLTPFARRTRPFSSALRALRQLRKEPEQQQRWQRGIKVLHEALNVKAGQTLLKTQLSEFLQQQPQLSAVETELKQFFLCSEAIFYAGQTLPPADFPWQRLESLCQQLAQLEMRE